MHERIFAAIAPAKPEALALDALRKTFLGHKTDGQRYLDDPKRTPLLEPLIPALSRAVLHWGARSRHLHVLHDEQSALTPERIVDIEARLGDVHPGHSLTLSRVDSLAEPRVQIADLVAGIGRRAARGVLLGRSDPELIELVTPLVDVQSVWPGTELVEQVGR